jgi:hypothetical protein
MGMEKPLPFRPCDPVSPPAVPRGRDGSRGRKAERTHTLSDDGTLGGGPSPPLRRAPNAAAALTPNLTERLHTAAQMLYAGIRVLRAVSALARGDWSSSLSPATRPRNPLGNRLGESSPRSLTQPHRRPEP